MYQVLVSKDRYDDDFTLINVSIDNSLHPWLVANAQSFGHVSLKITVQGVFGDTCLCLHADTCSTNSPDIKPLTPK